MSETLLPVRSLQLTWISRGVDMNVGFPLSGSNRGCSTSQKRVSLNVLSEKKNQHRLSRWRCDASKNKEKELTQSVEDRLRRREVVLQGGGNAILFDSSSFASMLDDDDRGLLLDDVEEETLVDSLLENNLTAELDDEGAEEDVRVVGGRKKQDDSMPLVLSTRRSKQREHRQYEDEKHVKVNSKRSMHLIQHRGVQKHQDVPVQYRMSPGIEYMDDITKDTEFLLNIRSWLHANRKSKRVRRRSSAGSASSSAAVTSFLVSLGNTPVLSAKQERRLALIIARGKAVREAAKELAREKKQRPSLQEVAEGAQLTSAHDAARAVMLAEDARSLMVEFNLRMVISIAKRYCGKGVELGDLIPEGLLGLRKAIDKFDATKGFKFSTYSHWWIRQAISRAVSDQGRDIRLPVHVVEFLSKMKRVSAELEADPNRNGPPTHRELAAAMGVSLPRLIALLQAAKSPRTGSDNHSGNFSSNVGNLGVDLADDDYVTTDEEGVNPVAEVERAEFLQETLSLMLSTLPLRERNVLRLRYGLHSAASASALKEVASELMIMGEDASSEEEEEIMSGLGLKEVGVIHQLCRERIRQIETDALRHLRVPWRINILKSVRAGKPLTPESIDRMLQATNEANQSLL